MAWYDGNTEMTSVTFTLPAGFPDTDLLKRLIIRGEIAVLHTQSAVAWMVNITVNTQRIINHNTAADPLGNPLATSGHSVEASVSITPGASAIPWAIDAFGRQSNPGTIPVWSNNLFEWKLRLYVVGGY